MNPVLIYTDTVRIASDKAMLTDRVTYLQSLYNAFKAINITLSIQDMSDVTSLARRDRTGKWLSDYVSGKLMVIIGTQSFNDIPLQADKIKELIVVPDLTTINSIIASFNYGGIYSDRQDGIRVDLLNLSEDIISKVIDSDTQIEAAYTYYTKTDDSAQLATNLQAVCDAMNSFDADYPTTIYVKRYGQFISIGGIIPGIKIVNGALCPSLEYIREFEANKAA